MMYAQLLRLLAQHILGQALKLLLSVGRISLTAGFLLRLKVSVCDKRGGDVIADIAHLAAAHGDLAGKADRCFILHEHLLLSQPPAFIASAATIWSFSILASISSQQITPIACSSANFSRRTCTEGFSVTLTARPFGSR